MEKPALEGQFSVEINSRIKQSSFTRNGSTVYGVDLLADEFSVLASKAERAVVPDPAPKAKGKARAR